MKDSSARDKNDGTYEDSCLRVFPFMKDAYAGIFTELEFSQNLALRSKFEVQSGHLSRK